MGRLRKCECGEQAFDRCTQCKQPVCTHCADLVNVARLTWGYCPRVAWCHKCQELAAQKVGYDDRLSIQTD